MLVDTGSGRRHGLLDELHRQRMHLDGASFASNSAKVLNLSHVEAQMPRGGGQMSQNCGAQHGRAATAPGTTVRQRPERLARLGKIARGKAVGRRIIGPRQCPTTPSDFSITTKGDVILENGLEVTGVLRSESAKEVLLDGLDRIRNDSLGKGPQLTRRTFSGRRTFPTPRQPPLLPRK